MNLLINSLFRVVGLKKEIDVPENPKISPLVPSNVLSE
jgi:hypothetical protein